MTPISLKVESLFAALNGRTILPSVSMNAYQGDFIGLIGPNGAGKSTLLKALAGVIPAEGVIAITETPLASMNVRERALLLSYLPQARPVHWAMPVRNIVALGRFAFGAGRLDAAGEAAIERAMEETGIHHLANRPVTDLSGGELARVHMARALCAETPILLADEPTAALDPAHQLSLMTILKARAAKGGLVIAALHDLPLAARFCSRIIVLSDGDIVANARPDEALSATLLRDVFNIEASVTPAQSGIAFHFSAPVA